ncbi:family 20 glycosylhydrolase [Pelagicoccus sp. SDUM812002]|uniref:beta-N-acetylhexosaminidase n=1 Tax=Pelagicoccus sp. SDUM812002 TaxID=3041266 RepID=UPI0028102244|nr:family 20 glycosylhydrolase [Pelagicoccus sp. SDUM812002]MDQ8186621.1 family 20 glycosylhydrolase [Pelagicoccus sp. SDUM812002]
MKGKRLLKTVAVALVMGVSYISLGSVLESEPAFSNLIPVPREVLVGEGRFRIDDTFTVKVSGEPDERMYPAASRFLRRLDQRTGLFLPQDYVEKGENLSEVGLEIVVERPGQVNLGEEESYHLSVTAAGVRIEAETDLGAMHGLETLLQLLSADDRGYYFPVSSISDMPRFPWRGLMIDSARHFMPLDVIKRNLDGMAAVKMNVLHWHLTEDQGFRVEVKSYPKLHEMGSDGMFYTQDQLKEIVAYASDRGIRVYPEFDVPGHATAWLVGHPEMASLPGPYEIERGWGIFDPTLDPTKDVVYEILEAVFTEMAAIFPDEYFHIGGDENEGHHWDKADHIQAFMKERGIADNHQLQSYFNKRLIPILDELGKKMVGWDEILQPDMPTNIMIHSWRGQDSMVAAAKAGYSSILSNGYYIDLMQPASDHYLVDPLPADIDLNEDQRSRVYGGEATMWSEHVTVETIDSRIWPRTAAIAERLWSDQSVDDVEDMYRRLDTIALQLEELGLTHLKNRAMMMRRLAGGYETEPLRVLADVVEPLKIYRRNSDLSYRSYSPYTLLPDVAVADAKDARRFGALVDQYLEMGGAEDKAAIRAQLEEWSENHTALSQLAARSPALREALPLSEALRDLAELALSSLDGEATESAAILERAREPVAKVELQVVDAVERLLAK